MDGWMYGCIDGRVVAVERNNNTRREVRIQRRTQNAEQNTDQQKQAGSARGACSCAQRTQFCPAAA